MTLVEVLIAILLLSVVGLAVISGMGTAFRANAVTQKQNTAMAIAQRQLEYLEHQDYQAAVAGVYEYPIFDLDDPDNPNPIGSIDIPTFEINYAKIPIDEIPAGYSVWSVNSAEAIVTDIKGVPWDSSYGNGTASTTDNGLQRIKLVIAQGTDPYITLNKIVLTLETYKYGVKP